MKKKKAVKTILFFVSVLLISAFLSGIAAFLFMTRGVRLDAKAFEDPVANLIMLDANGTEIEYASSLKVFSESEDISDNIKKAFVTVEDKRFYKHHGLDYIRIAGAAVHDIKAGAIKEGGSTITQQLAKNAILTNDKTLERKLKEAKLAYQIEKKYDKEEILTIYLNTIYFGNGIYGITAAADRIFNKTPAEITLPEAAMLTGIVRNPGRYSPLISKEKAEERMKHVLAVMKKEGVIAEQEYNEALQYHFTMPPVEKADNSYPNAAIDEAARLLGIGEKELLSKNYTIITYLDRNMQKLAEKAIKSEELAPEKGCERLILIADNRTGGITAYSSNFSFSPFALYRSPGSAIKPIFVYAPALDAGYITPATPVLDEKTDFDGYAPDNYGDNYAGWTTIRQAVKASSNVVSVKLAREMGIDYLKYRAKDFGLTLAAEDGLSAALGGLTEGVTPVELTTAYMTLARGGDAKSAGFVHEIQKDGKIVYTRETDGKRAISQEASYLMTDMLIDTAKYGTARKLATLPFEVAAKTGTVGVKNTDYNSDAWNMSYTSANTVCVWYGSVSNTQATLLPSAITGGSYPTLCAKYIYENLSKPDPFDVPDGIIAVDVDTYATNIEHKLLIAGETTPIKYRCSELFNERVGLPEISTVFDRAIPSDLHAEINENNQVDISFSLCPGFRYVLKKQTGEGDLILAEYCDNEKGFFTDAFPSFGLNIYYISVYDPEGEMLGESSKVSALNFTLPEMPPI
jgi:penicillin-binding protein 2A